MARPEELMQVRMIRQTTGEHRAILRVGSFQIVPVKFGSRLIAHDKAVAATEADAAAAKKTGPIVAADGKGDGKGGGREK